MDKWRKLIQYLEEDYASVAVVTVLELVELGETPQDIRRYLIKNDSSWWKDD
jgi:hypothetical protein